MRNFLSVKAISIPLIADPTIDVGVANVTFEPGCRNNWHIHHEGYQLLLVTGEKAGTKKKAKKHVV
jgi:quercetin dioxygenase-like cupin family protein